MADALERIATTRPVLAIGTQLDPEILLRINREAFDPHLWMDPVLWSMAIEKAATVLASHDPDGAAAMRRNADRYFARLSALDSYARRIIATIPGPVRVLVTAHDAFGYFGRRYGLEVFGIQGLSTESEAGLHKIEAMVEILVRREIPAVFVETSVSDRNVQALIEGAAARGHSVKLGGRLFSDAMGRPGSYEGSYIGMMDHNVTTIARALGGDAPERGMNGMLNHDD